MAQTTRVTQPLFCILSNKRRNALGFITGKCPSPNHTLSATPTDDTHRDSFPVTEESLSNALSEHL